MEGTIEALSTGDGSEPVVVNLGPQHPSTHGVFRLKATLDGERVHRRRHDRIGYLHRSMEKLAEERTFTQNIPFTDRIDYLAAMSNNLAYCLAVGRSCCGIEVPPRAQAIRILFAELQRLASPRHGQRHLRQRLRRLADAALPHVPRARAHPRYVRDDLRRPSDDQLHAHRRRRLRSARRSCCPTLELLPRRPARQTSPGVRSDLLLEQRDPPSPGLPRRGGDFGAEDADQRLALAGPVLRATGVPWDSAQGRIPTAATRTFDFDIPVGRNRETATTASSSAWKRCKASRCTSCEQLIDNIPGGAWLADAAAARCARSRGRGLRPRRIAARRVGLLPGRQRRRSRTPYRFHCRAAQP